MARRRSIVMAELDGVEIRSDPDNPDGRLMLIDGIDASYVDLDDPTYLDFGYVRRIGDVVDVAWPRRAGPSLRCTSEAPARPCRATSGPPARAPTRSCYEIDLRVVTLAREHLGLKAGGGIKLRHEDGRLGLARIGDASMTCVVGDAFDGTQVPPTLGSAEAAAQVARVLKPGWAVRAQRHRLAAAVLREGADSSPAQRRSASIGRHRRSRGVEGATDRQRPFRRRPAWARH